MLQAGFTSPSILAVQLLSTARFMLRKRLSGGSSGGEAASGTEELPCATPAGEEVFLFHLGYRAPGPYQLFIGTAAQVWLAGAAVAVQGRPHAALVTCSTDIITHPCCCCLGVLADQRP
jgi:hypothetical protein